MPKISSTNNSAFFTKFAVKVILSTVLSLLLFNALAAFLFLITDFSLEYVKYCELIICSLSAFITSYVSITGLKQNYILISLFSALPLIFYSLINTIINRNDVRVFIMKIILIVLFSLLSAIIKTFGKRRK